jgi:hypothetical protein
LFIVGRLLVVLVIGWVQVISFIKHAKSINFTMFVFNQSDFFIDLYNNKLINYFLNNRVARRQKKSALPITAIERLSTSQLNKPAITPRLAPRVLNQIIVAAILRAISNSKNSVVKRRSASTSENSRLVKLELTLVRLNRNRDWLLGKSRHHLRIVRRANIDVLSDLASGVNGARLLARSLVLGVAREIRVIRLEAETAILRNPAERIVHQTTIASLVTSTVTKNITINQLLLREGN